MVRPLPAWSTLTLRVVTPAFIGGAEPRRTDAVMALRPASLRGVWRLWLRMGLGAVLRGGGGDPGRRRQVLADLRRLEEHLFGTTGEASRVRLHLSASASPAPVPAPDRDRSPGQRYLGYGIFEGPTPLALLPGAELSLRVAVTRSGRDTDEHHQAATQALWAVIWMWANLGGIGARSRRGWGAVEITAVSGQPTLAPTPKGRSLSFGERPASLAEVAPRLDEGLAAALWSLRRFAEALDVRTSRQEPALPELRTLAGLTAFRVLPVPFPSAREALETGGALLQDFRSTLRRSGRRAEPLPDYFEVKRTLQGEQARPKTVVRAAFGLPLPFFFRSLNGAKTTVLPEAPRILRYRGPRLDRLPSALLFRVVPLRGGSFALVLLDLEEGATPLAGCTLTLKEGRGPEAGFPAPSREAVAQFLTFAMDRARHLAREAR